MRDLCKLVLVSAFVIFDGEAIAQSISFSPRFPTSAETVVATLTEPFNCTAQQPTLSASSVSSFTFDQILPNGIVNCPFIPSPPPATSAFLVNLGLLPAGNYTVTWNIYLSQSPEPPRLLSSTSASLVVTPRNGAVTISSGYTGNWYNSASSGQGFSIEVLRDNTMLAEWFAFGPYGGQAWIAATGPITGDTAVLQGYFPVGPGGRFPPNFDPSQLQDQYWGTITFAFTDCNTGRVSWLPTVAGFTSGSMAITRLTLPAGLSCP